MRQNKIFTKNVYLCGYFKVTTIKNQPAIISMSEQLSTLQIASRIKSCLNGRAYSGPLSKHVSKAIEESLTNYSVRNLLSYCHDMNIKVIIIDENTEDKFPVLSIFELYETIQFIMRRYLIDPRQLTQMSGVGHSYIKALTKIEEVTEATPLSINALIAFFTLLHCDLLFQPII